MGILLQLQLNTGGLSSVLGNSRVGYWDTLNSSDGLFIVRILRQQHMTLCGKRPVVYVSVHQDIELREKHTAL